MVYSAEHPTQDIVASDRPAIYLGMGHTEMDALDSWLSAQQSLADQALPAHKEAYLLGVYFGLSQIGMGLSLLTEVAFPEGWVDAAGNGWLWNDEEFRPVIDGSEYVASTLDMDIQDVSEADFVAFARGVWGATNAARLMYAARSVHCV